MSIDYGMGRTNINHETGIRYGVISQHSVTQAWCDSAEPDYGEPHCPKCGNKATDEFDCDECAESDYEITEHGCADYCCHACKYVFDGQEAFGDEPQGWNYNGDGYTLTDCLDSDIFVLNSPYYTFADFCSPCVPGAGNLNSDNQESGVKTYCLGHNWFESNEAPYAVYSVATGKLVMPWQA